MKSIFTISIFLLLASAGICQQTAAISDQRSDSALLVSFVTDLKDHDIETYASASELYNKYFCLNEVPVTDTTGHKINNMNEFFRLKTMLNINPVFKVYPYEVHRKLHHDFADLKGHPKNTYAIDIYSDSGRLGNCGFAYVLNGKIVSIKKRAGRYRYKDWL